MIKRYWPTLVFTIIVLLLFTSIKHLLWNTPFDSHELDAIPSGKYTFLVVHKGRPGEKEYASRLIRAANTLGWNGYEVSLKPSRWLKIASLQPFAHIVKKANPHFIFSMTKELPPHETRSLYLLLSDREYDSIANNTEEFVPGQWNAILASSPLLAKLQTLYPTSLPHCLPWHWGSFATEYYKPTPRRLFQLNPSVSFYKLHSLLERSGYLDTIYQTKDITDQMEAIHRAGIALVLHSEHQLDSAIPSLHFFDAVASSAVVIADRHSFIEQEFQDSVLYVDREYNGEEMFLNIDQLIEWIWNHQEEAVLLAQKAHTIFQERFTIQKLLTDLEHIICG